MGLVLLMMLPIGFSANLIVQNFTPSSVGAMNEFKRNTGTFYIANDFNFTNTTTVCSIQIQIQKVGSPTWNSYASIYNTNVSGFPTTLIANSSAVVNVATFTPSGSGSNYAGWNLTSCVALTNGVRYAIVLGGDGAWDGVNYVNTMGNVRSGFDLMQAGATFTGWNNYNTNYGWSFRLWNDGSGGVTNSTFTTTNFYTGSTINSFCVTNGSLWGCTTNGTATIVGLYTNVSSLQTIRYESNESGGYYNVTYTSINVSTTTSKTMAQSVVSFTATQKISNATISGANFTSIYLTNTTHYMSNGTFLINATKSGYFTKAENVTAVALTSSSVNIEDMTDTRLNLTIKSALTNATITSWTTQVNISTYGYSQNITTTNGASLTDLVSGSYTALIDATGYALTTASFNLTAGTNNVTLYVYTSESVNVTFKNEITGVVINTTTTTLELISDVAAYNYSTATGYLYFDLVSPTSYISRYYASGYSERFSYLEISSRSNQNLTLYLLPVNASTNVTLTVINENAQPVQNALVRVLKYDLSTNSYIEREVKFTDFAGQIIFAIEYASEFYKFFVEYPEGETVLTTEPAYISSTTLTLQINTRSAVVNLDNYLGITSDLTFNTATNNYRSEFSNSENLLSNVCVYVYRTDINRTLYGTSCSTIGSQSGTVLVSVLNTSGREYRADLYYNFSGDLYYARSKSVSFAQGVDWGVWGLVIVTLLTVALVFMFKESLVIAVSVAPLPMLMGSLTGIILIPVWVSFGIEILALVLAYLISRYAQ